MYRLFKQLFALTLIAVLLGVATVVTGYIYIAPTLPDAAQLREVQLQVPLRVFARGGELMAEFGEMKRTPLQFHEIPQTMIQAITAAEDNRFFEHQGVDFIGLLRASYNLIRTGQKGQGGSTITMQVARNFFLTREKTYLRKLNEIVLAIKIEQELTKGEILELYLNKIYLGERAYGIEAAAQIYYGQSLNQLSLPQWAMLAGLPKAPSAYNPVADPERALLRRNYVLGRMHELKMIDTASYQSAMLAPVTAKIHKTPPELDAPFITEMVRAEMVKQYGTQAYEAGFSVYTTIDAKLQRGANQAVQTGLLEYDMRHGYRGPEGHVDLPPAGTTQQHLRALQGYSAVGGLQPALIIALTDTDALFDLGDGISRVISWDGMRWAKPYINDDRVGAPPKQSSDILSRGDIVRVLWQENGYQLRQIPQVSSALVSLRPRDGALLALVGGFDFYHSKFNRATQAQRQPGSNLKPFVYSAALDHGYTTASLINDAPIVFEDDKLESEWRPENYSGRFFGPTRLREGLIRSRNLVSIRLLRDVGLATTRKHLELFGFDPAHLPNNLTLALGSASVTPYELARGYAVLANNGYLVDTYFINRIEDSSGNTLFRADPLTASCPTCPTLLPTTDASAHPLPATAVVPTPRPAPQTVSPQNTYLVQSMLRDVIRRGTGRRALALGRQDIAGKTGTTNEQRDAWFSGFNRDVATTTWVGFDNLRPLGKSETGGSAALPIWIDYMRVALEGIEDLPRELPAGLVTIRIDPATGEYADINNPKAIFEVFRTENAPTPPIFTQSVTAVGNSTPHEDQQISEELF